MLSIFTNNVVQLSLINGRAGDPGLYGFFPKTGEAILFDLGSLELISHKELLKVKYICISHAHMDHFIGFDRLLRVNIAHRRKLFFVGPEDISQRILAKIQSYTWNLIEDGQIDFQVLEVLRDGSRKFFQISNLDGEMFCRVASFFIHEEDLHSSFHGSSGIAYGKPCKVVDLKSVGSLSAVALDHGIDSISFCFRFSASSHVNMQALNQLNIHSGAWIKEVQRAFMEHDINAVVKVQGLGEVNAYELGEKILTRDSGFSFVYTTDIAYSDPNLESLKSLAQVGVDLYVCEANYLHSEEAKALEKKHLTTVQAAKIARACKAKKLEIFHVSALYGGNTIESEVEAEKAFLDL